MCIVTTCFVLTNVDTMYIVLLVCCECCINVVCGGLCWFGGLLFVLCMICCVCNDDVVCGCWM